MQMTKDPIMLRGGLAIPPALISKGLPLLKQTGIPTAMGALASLGDNLVDEIFGDGKTKGIRKGIRRGAKGFRPKKGFMLKKRAPRSKHQGKKQMFQKLGNKMATSTGNQTKKFFKKKKPGEWLRRLSTRSAGNSLHRKSSDWNPSPRTPLLQNNSERA